jgi:hypothetical protein
MRRSLATLLLIGAVSLGASAPADAHVYVNIRPPAIRIETRSGRPGPGYSWVPGYYRWDGGAYVWVSGRWERPPHRHHRWARGHWAHHRHHGWFWVEGHWR